MPQKVFNNVEDHRLIDNGRVVEDVTKISLPTIKNKTTTVNVSGMVADVDIPNPAHVEAMDFTIAHNNGINCQHLADPGKHTIELRIARQVYNTASGTLGHGSVKVRLVGFPQETPKGDVEKDNPLGSTTKYSCSRYEEEIDGEIVTIIDAMAGVVRYNGVDYTDSVESLLN